MTAKLTASLGRVAAPSYAAKSLEAYEAWRRAHLKKFPTCSALLPRAAIIRRICQLHSAGDSFAEIGRCCGLSGVTAKRAWQRLPEALR